MSCQTLRPIRLLQDSPADLPVLVDLGDPRRKEIPGIRREDRADAPNPRFLLGRKDNRPRGWVDLVIEGRRLNQRGVHPLAGRRASPEAAAPSHEADQ